jgi:hypothetical protein
VVDLNKVLELEKSIKKMENEKLKAEGKVEQLLKTLQDKFNCNTLNEAQALLEKKQSQLNKLEEQFTKKRTSYEDKWEKDLKIIEP